MCNASVSFSRVLSTCVEMSYVFTCLGVCGVFFISVVNSNFRKEAASGCEGKLKRNLCLQRLAEENFRTVERLKCCRSRGELTYLELKSGPPE